MASKFRSTSGGTGLWSDTTGTWVTTSGGGVTTTAPTTADTAFLDANSGNLALDNTTNVCGVLNCTGYTHTLTFTTSDNLAVSGAVTLPTGGGGTVAGSGDLQINATSTIANANGVTLGGNLIFNNASTKTLSNNLTVTGALICQTGASVLNGNTLTCGGLTNTAVALSGTTNIVFGGSGTWSASSSAGTVANNITINTGGTLTIGSNVYYKTGTLTYTAGTVTVTSSTFNIAGSTTLNCASVTWNNVSVTAASTITMSANINLTGDLNFAAGAVTFSGAHNISTVNLDFNTASTHVLSGTISATGTTTVTAATVLNGSQNINVATLTVNAAISGNTSVTINASGTWSGSSTISNSLIFNAPATSYTISGTVSLAGSPTMTSIGTVTTTGSTLNSVTSLSLPTTSITWNTINTGSDNSAHALTLTADATLNGNFQMQGNTTWTGSHNINCVSFATNNNGTSATHTLTGDVHASGQININSAGGTTVLNGHNIYYATSLHADNSANGTTVLVWNGSGTGNYFTSSGPVVFALNINVNGSGDIPTVLTDFYYQTGTILYVAGTNGSNSNGKIHIRGNCTLDYGGNILGQQIAFDLGTPTLTLGSDVKFTGLLTATSTTTVNGSGKNLYIAGGLTVSAPISGTAKIILNGTGTWSSGGSADTISNDLQINTAGAITLSGIVYYTGGTLTYTAGTVTVTSSTLYVTGNASLDTSGLNHWNIVIFDTATITLVSDLYAAEIDFKNSVAFAGAFKMSLSGGTVFHLADVSISKVNGVSVSKVLGLAS